MTLDYRNPTNAAAPPFLGWRKVLGWSLALLIVLALLGTWRIAGALGRARETAKRVMCASNLRQIGAAALLFEDGHNGQFPPDLPTLLITEDLSAHTYICPSSKLDKAAGPTTQQVVKSLLAGGHQSYVWAGAGLTNNMPADVILAFDLELHVPADADTTTGMNILHADGSVEFVTEKQAKAIWAQYVSGVRPLRLPASPTP